MNELKTQINPVKQLLALATVGGCLLLGVLGAFLFDKQHWGINIALFSVLLVTIFLLLRRRQQPLSYVGYALIASGLFFALTFAWRDSLILNGLSALGILLTINFAFTLGARKQLQRLNVSEVFQDLLNSTRYGLNSYYGLLTIDIRWDEVQARWGTIGRSVARGLIMTIPLLMVFGYLLTASDARFEETINQLLNWGWNKEIVIQYLLTFLLCSWIAAAVFRGGVLNQGLIQKRPVLPRWKISRIEIVMILSTLNLLFLGFIIVQFTYFFGGDTLVQTSQDATYAGYARRGFFQLVTLASLVMALLLFAHWLYKPSSQLEKKIYTVLAIIMIIMTMIIEASAAHRMFLYINVYGLTELRFYTSVFMLWLVIIFILFSLTALHKHGERTHFVFGTILTALLFIVVLHLINPDARIAEVNLTRLQAGERFEANYVTSLSADVVPTLLTALPNLSPKERCTLWSNLQSRRVLKASSDNWRGWHWSRNQALTLLSETSSPCNN